MLCKYLVNKIRLMSTEMTQKPQTGIVLLNMGGPQKLEDVNDFLFKILTDHQVIELPILQKSLGGWMANRRTEEVKKKYAKIGGRSPIYEWTQKQGELLCRQLDRVSPYTAPHKHYIAFRYCKPLTKDAFRQIEQDNLQRLIIFSQYPQYSCATSGSSFNEVHKFYKNRKLPKGMKISIIDRWSTHPLLIKTFSSLIRAEIRNLPEDRRKNAVILFSAHSLPLKSVYRGDSYPSEVGATVQMVMDELNYCNPYQLTWQSQFGPSDWLKPSTDDTIRSFIKQGKKTFVLVPISFVNEHIETLYEMDIEFCQDLAASMKVDHIRRVPAPNDHPLFIEAMTSLVKTHMDVGPPIGHKFLSTCPHCINKACFESKKWFAEICKNH